MQKQIGKFRIETSDHQLEIILEQEPNIILTKRKRMRIYSPKPENIKKIYRDLKNTTDVKKIVTEHFVINKRNEKNIDFWNLETQDFLLPNQPIKEDIWNEMFDPRFTHEQVWCTTPTHCRKELTTTLSKDKQEVKEFINQINTNPEDIIDLIKLKTSEIKDTVDVDFIQLDTALDSHLYGIKVQYDPNKRRKDLFEFK